MRIPFTFMCVLALGVMGCPESGDRADSGCHDGGVTVCTDNRDGIKLCALGSGEPNFWEPPELCAEGEACVPEPGADARCVAGTGGTSGTGGTAGTGGGASSCAEVNIPGEAQLAGTLSISPTVATFDDVMIVTVDVDADAREVTALLRNESSGVLGGSGVALTSGNETVEVNVRVETTSQPGPHTLDIELGGDPPDPLDYILYTPGDGDTYVRIKFENDLPGPETATTCLEVSATIQ